MSAYSHLIKFALFVLFLFSSLEAADKNVILIVTDDQSQTMGCYGDPIAKTPNMDTLAEDGTRFRFAFATTASCSASRSVILTGLHNHANGQYGHAHAFHKFNSFDNIVSLPRYLNAAGYRTARCGKYHVAPEVVYQFEEAIPGNGRNALQMANNCRSFLASGDERPFFLYFCTSDPHRGGGVATELPENPDRFGNPAPGKSHQGITEVIFNPDDITVPGFLPDTAASRAELAQYYQSIARIDQGLGQLWSILKETGHWDDTMIIFISDHGMAFPGAKTNTYEGGLLTPCLVRNPYEQKRGVVSDAMVSWVDLTPTILDYAGAYDAVNQSVVSSVAKKIDRLKVNDQTNRKIPHRGFHGRSFLSVLGDEQPSGWDTIYASHTFHEIPMYYPMRVVRERQYKLIWNLAWQLPYPHASDLAASATWKAQAAQGMDAPYGYKTVGEYLQRSQFELYDVKSDPHEGVNLAEVPTEIATLERLQKKLEQFMKQSGDPWIEKWPAE